MERKLVAKQPNNPESLRRKITHSLAIAFLGLPLLTSCIKNQEVRPPSYPPSYPPNVYELPALTNEEPTPTTFFSTNWRVCATIQEGEGPIAALRRAAQEQNGGGEPHEWSEERQKVEIKHKDDSVDVYTWEELLKINPLVYPGDEVCDTLQPHLSATTTPSPEDVHR